MTPGMIDLPSGSVDVEHDVEHVLHLHVVDPGPHVDAVAGVIAHPVFGDSRQRVVDRLDLAFGPGAAVGDAELRILDVVVDQMGIVDLEQESGVDDGAVFHIHGIGDGVEEFLIRSVMLVQLVAGDVAGRDRRHEGLFGAGRIHRRPQIGEIAFQQRASGIAHRSGADHLFRRVQRPQIGLDRGSVEFGEIQRLARAGPDIGARLGARRVTAEPFVDIDGEAALAELAVIDDIYAELDLLFTMPPTACFSLSS